VTPLNSNWRIFIIVVLFLGFFSLSNFSHGYGQDEEMESTFDFDAPAGSAVPSLKDYSLRTEVAVDGLEFPTTAAFVGPNDILVLEKEKGTVLRIIDGKRLTEPLLDVNVASKEERGMLGIAVMNIPGHNYVFLYYTEAAAADGEDITEDEKEPLGNRLYRYELVNNKLVNPKLLLDLPSSPGPAHNGGAITIGPDGSIYLAVGDVRCACTQVENVQDGEQADGRSGILRITQDGKVSNSKGILGEEHPLNMYYAYGIRNSFGIDFDPITGNLWDTELANHFGDEINLVEPGFNSGADNIAGMWAEDEEGNMRDLTPKDVETLVNFDGKGEYSPPEFTWMEPVTPTAIKFFHSDKLGPKYQDNIFIGGFNHGYLYLFEPSPNRTHLVLNNDLNDKIADSSDELDTTIVGEGFGGISDIEIGPDGYLYVVSITEGKIFRIVNTSN
jgi:aldose sugar dehydrogenase